MRPDNDLILNSIFEPDEPGGSEGGSRSSSPDATGARGVTVPDGSRTVRLRPCRRMVLRFGVLGFGVGLGFPVLATILDAWTRLGSVALPSLIEAHGSSVMHLIIDTAPVVLGLIAAGVGRERARLLCLLKEMDATVQERTGWLEELNNDLEAQTQEHKRARREFETIYQTTPLGILVLDAEGRIIRWNEAFLALTGRSEEELSAVSPMALVHPEEREELALLWKRAVEQGDRQVTEIRYLPSDQEERIVRITAVALTGIDSEESGLLAIVEDITDRRLAESGMRALEVQLRHAQKLEAIGQLAAGIAHEINTPTQYVSDNVVFVGRAFEGFQAVHQSLAGLIAEEKSRGAATFEAVEQVMGAKKIEFLMKEVPRALGQAREGLERVRGIVAAMKEFSHPSRGALQDVDLAATLQTTITVARNEWKYVAELETEFDPDLPSVPVLRDELNQVVLNLIVNAAHAIGGCQDGRSGEKGLIRVSTRRNGPWAEIRVSDSGCGIPEEIRDRIFEPFYTTKEVGRGTGQGLAIARAVIVDKHLGRLDVESEVGRGSTFIIRLPLERKAETEGREAA